MAIGYIKRLAGPYIGDGTGQKTFSFGFFVFTEGDVYVATAATENGSSSTLQQGTDYTVTLNADQEASPGGTITLTAEAGLADGAVLVIGSDVDYTQTLDLTNYTRFPPARISEELDRIVVQIQQLVEILGRTVKVDATDTMTPEELKQQLLEVAASAGTYRDEALAAAEAAAASAASAAESAATVGTILPDIADVKTVAANITDVVSVAGGIEDVGTVAESIEDVNAVVDHMSEVSSVGQNIDDVETVSASIDSVNIVAGDLEGEESPLADEDYGEYGQETDDGTVAITGGNIKIVADNIADIQLLGQYAQDGTLEKAASSAADAADSADKAKDWATKMDGLVDGEDYSAKFYASQAKDKVDGAATAIDSARATAVQAVETAQSSAVSAVETAGTSAVDSVSDSVAAAQKSATDAAASASAAKSSEDEASSSASAASGSASSASQFASAASQSAQTASSSATNAGEAASAASLSAETATTKASEAQASASAAAGSASAANTAKQSAESAAQRAEEAASSVGDPLGKEEASQTYATKTELTTGLQGKAATDHAHSLSLGGDASGTASIGATPSTLTVTLTNSGVTAGNYGQSSGGTISWGGNFIVPQFSVDAKGRVTTARNWTLSLPEEVTWETLSGKPSTFTPAAHSHEIAQVNGLQQALDGKQPTGNYSTAGHTHTKSDVTDFAHSHAISDVTGLQEALDAKATSSELGALAKKNKITLDDIEGDIDLGEYADG